MFRRTASARLWRSSFCAAVNRTLAFLVGGFAAGHIRELIGWVPESPYLGRLEAGFVSGLVGGVPGRADLGGFEARLVWLLVLDVSPDCSCCGRSFNSGYSAKNSSSSEWWRVAMLSAYIVSEVQRAGAIMTGLW